MKTHMSIQQQKVLSPSALALALAIGLAGVFSAAHAGETQKTFATPEAAAQALATAARASDERALEQILGASWNDALGAGDAAADKAALHSFVTQYDQMHRWTAMTDGSRVLHIGADNYAYPVPLAGNAPSWHFDAAAGAREIDVRRIGANELLAIDAVNVIADAEEAYLDGARDDDTREYATTIVSSDGKRDGLYWSATASREPSPLAALGTLAADSATLGQPLVLDGYSYRILQAQGDTAPGGAASYVKDGAMTGGFAVLASPVEYGSSGIMSFMLSRDGVVYQKDLGRQTVNVAATMTAYNPGDGWTSVE